MTRIRQFQLAGLLLATGGLVLTYGLNGQWRWAWVFVVLGLLWWSGGRRSWRVAPGVGLTGIILGAVAGVWLGISPLYMLVVTAAALSAWDLDHFERRLQLEARAVSPKGDESVWTLANRHLRKLFVVVASGVLVAGLGLSLQVELNFWIVALLGLLLAFSLSRAFLLMANEANSHQSPYP